jgi:hypothetical protein
MVLGFLAVWFMPSFLLLCLVVLIGWAIAKVVLIVIRFVEWLFIALDQMLDSRNYRRLP